MASMLIGEPSHHGATEGNFKVTQEKIEEFGTRWYFSRKEIEENSPSRRDGIDLKKEVYWRKSYCTFLQDLGMSLKVPQVTIPTAIIFSHRFFLRQSHAKNDRRLEMVEECLKQANDLNGLLLLYSSLGNVEGITELASLAKEHGKNNVAFLCLFMLGKLEGCLQLVNFLIYLFGLPVAYYDQ